MRNLFVGIGGEEDRTTGEREKVERGEVEGEGVGEMRGKKRSTFSTYRADFPSSSPNPDLFNPIIPSPNLENRGSTTVDARLVLFKGMNHLQSLVALMRDSKYSALITKEIDEVVWG